MGEGDKEGGEWELRSSRHLSSCGWRGQATGAGELQSGGRRRRNRNPLHHQPYSSSYSYFSRDH